MRKLFVVAASTVLGVIGLGLLAGPMVASATTYSNTPAGGGGAEWLGSSYTTVYGEVFTLGSASEVLDWGFYANSGLVGSPSNGNLSFNIAYWNGSYAYGGSALYSVIGAYSASGGSQTLAFNSIDTALGAGTYVAYLSVANVASPVPGIDMSTSGTDGGLGGAFVFLNSSGVDPLTLTTPWTTGGNYLTYTADIVAVPEPSTYALLLAGLGLLGVVAHRRQKIQP